MINKSLKSLLLTSALVITFTYGIVSLIVEIFTTILPVGFIIVGLITFAIYSFRIPPPSNDSVEAIIGKDLQAAENNDFAIKTIAHRGAGLDAPENTLAAFQMCKEKGCDTIEFDVTLTKDDVPVVFHDDTLERLTSLNIVVGEQNWQDLAAVDLSVKHPFQDRFPKANIPTLEETVTQLLNSGQRMIIDIKDNNKKLVKIIHELYRKHNDLYSRAIVSSFYPNIIYFIRRGDPKIVCSLAWRPHVFAYDSYNYPQGRGPRRSDKWYKHTLLKLCDVINQWALPRVTFYILGVSVILLHKDVVTGKALLDWRKKGLRVMAWTVNTPAEKQYFARVLKITYLTDTLTGEGTTHSFTY